MPKATKRGRRILAAGARTVGRGMWRTITRTDAGAHWAKVGEDWYQTLGDLKGAAMKLGQLASQYHDLLPPELSKQLARLQASAEPLAWEHIHAELNQQWSASQWKLIDTIDPQPLASASIGQVHVAQLQQGQTVAVKVRYPGVAAAMDSDIKKLGLLLSTAGMLPLDRASLKGLLAEIRERLSEEMDYQREREHLERFGALPNTQGLVIPGVISELCTDGIIVTEYVDGDDLDTAQHWPQALRDAIGERYVDWLLEQIFNHGIVHADPHPGNFKFRRDGSIVLLDFGCVKQVAERERQLMAALVRAAVESDYLRLHQCLGELGGLRQAELAMAEPIETIYADSADFFRQRLLAEPHFDFGEPNFIPDARAIGRRALPQWRAFKPIPELAFVARALSGGYWLLRRLGARVNLAERVEKLDPRPGDGIERYKG